MRAGRPVVLTSLFLIALSAVVLSAVPSDSLQWAERLLERTRRYPVGVQAGSWPARDQAVAVEAYREILRKYGPDARAYDGLGRGLMLQGNYGEAVSVLEQAFDLAPTSRVVQFDLEQARKATAVVEAAAGLLPQDHSVLRAVPYLVPNTLDLWLILSAAREPTQEHPLPWRRDLSAVRLDLVKFGEGELSPVWHAEGLGSSGYTEGLFHDVQMTVANLNPDIVPEVLVPKTFLGASWVPSHLEIFGWQDGRVVKLLGVKSHDPLIVKDIDLNGTYEVLAVRPIGASLAHYQQPRWIDIYAFKQGTYQLANGDFPRQYNLLAAEIDRMLSEEPDDWELLKYRGIIHRMQGEPEEAVSCFEHALEALEELKSTTSDVDDLGRIRDETADIARRLNKYR